VEEGDRLVRDVVGVHADLREAPPWPDGEWRSTAPVQAQEEDDGVGVIAAVLYNSVGPKASCGRMGTLASVLEAGQHRAHRCSGGVCGEAKAVPSEERGGESDG
jgi:hypothetical protein